MVNSITQITVCNFSSNNEMGIGTMCSMYLYMCILKYYVYCVNTMYICVYCVSTMYKKHFQYSSLYFAL